MSEVQLLMFAGLVAFVTGAGVYVLCRRQFQWTVPRLANPVAPKAHDAVIEAFVRPVFASSSVRPDWNEASSMRE